jgi:hypothetical protein
VAALTEEVAAHKGVSVRGGQCGTSTAKLVPVWPA